MNYADTLTAAMALPAPRPRGALFARFCRVDIEAPPPEFFLVECGNRLTCATPHLYEPKAAQSPGLTVRDQIDIFDWSIGAKKLLNLFGCRTKGEIADVNV